jgi:hypothetical protein
LQMSQLIVNRQLDHNGARPARAGLQCLNALLMESHHSIGRLD